MSDASGPRGGFPAPPAWTTAPPPPGPVAPRRRRAWPWVLGGVLALIVGLGITGGIVFVQKVKPVIDAANSYLDDLASRDYERAFDQLCERSQNDSSPQSFENDIANDALGSLNSYDVDAFDVSIDGDRASVGLDLEAPRFDIEDVLELRFQKEDGEWKPCGNFYGFAFNF